MRRLHEAKDTDDEIDQEDHSEGAERECSTTESVDKVDSSDCAGKSKDGTNHGKKERRDITADGSEEDGCVVGREGNT
ncbi:hypothetical protein HG530_014868 [Fusarium avenaceum]|nr:hypothetical protein HG530_014868 [Fusarium avenaceum]